MSRFMGVLEQRMGEPFRMDGLKVATVTSFMLFLQQENPH